MSAKINPSNYSPPNVNYWGDRCERAEAEIERLRAALTEIANDGTRILVNSPDIARAALNSSQQDALRSKS